MKADEEEDQVGGSGGKKGRLTRTEEEYCTYGTGD